MQSGYGYSCFGDPVALPLVPSSGKRSCCLVHKISKGKSTGLFIHLSIIMFGRGGKRRAEEHRRNFPENHRN